MLIPDEDTRTHFDRRARREIAKSVWDKFVLCSSHATISIYPYAIQITVFPPSGEEFSVPDTMNAVHMTIRDNNEIEEYRV